MYITNYNNKSYESYSEHLSGFTIYIGDNSYKVSHVHENNYYIEYPEKDNVDRSTYPLMITSTEDKITIVNLKGVTTEHNRFNKKPENLLPSQFVLMLIVGETNIGMISFDESLDLVKRLSYIRVCTDTKKTKLITRLTKSKDSIVVGTKRETYKFVLDIMGNVIRVEVTHTAKNDAPMTGIKVILRETYCIANTK